MKYQLRNGRIVKDGEYVQVKLTPRMVKYFKSIGALTELPDTSTTADDFDFVNLLNTFFK